MTTFKKKNNRMIKKILVTGSEGFIGSHLVEFLVKKKISNKCTMSL